MSNVRKIIGVLMIALCMAIIAPATVPLTTSVTTVEAAKVKISKKKVTMIKGQSLKLEVKNNSKKVMWSTTDKEVATVAKNGKIKAKKAGTATIIAKIGKKQYKCTVNVETPKISNTTITLVKGSSTTLDITGNTQKVKWSTSNQKIASVDKNGKVTAKGNGTATITATIGSKKYKCKVNVKKLNNNNLSKNVSYKSYEAPNKLIVKFTNNNDVNIQCYFEVVYYDSFGNMIYTDDFFKNYFNVIEPGKNQIAYFSYPKDNYSSYKIKVSAKMQDRAIGMVDNINVTSSSSSNGVTAKIQNTSSKAISVTYIYILYYKNNEVVGFDWDNIYDFKGLDSKYMQFSNPYDDNYNDINFDRYEIFVCDTFRDK